MPPATPTIVTLLPSATEIVCALGLADQIVGVTHECDYPAGVEQRPHVTRSTISPDASSGEIDAAVRSTLASNQVLYELDESRLRELAPDIIVSQSLCDVCAVSDQAVQRVIQRLPKTPMLLNLTPMTLGEVFDTILQVGAATGEKQRAADHLESLIQRVDRIRVITDRLPHEDKPTVGFIEWTDPLFNGGHWTPELIEIAGGIDSFGNKHAPSESISDERLLESDPEVLIVAPCGFDEHRAQGDLEALKQRVDFNQLKAYRNGRVHILDGNSTFSRPGPRLVDSLEILFKLLHPTSASSQ